MHTVILIEFKNEFENWNLEVCKETVIWLNLKKTKMMEFLVTPKMIRINPKDGIRDADAVVQKSPVLHRLADLLEEKHDGSFQE